MATKKAAPKKAAKKAPKAPAEKFIVVRDSCENVVCGQLMTKAAAINEARSYALEFEDAHTIYKVVGVQRYSVPCNIIVEDLQ